MLVKLLPHAFAAPKYMSDGASGMDLYSAEDYVVRAKFRVVVSTGVCIQLDPGIEGQVRSRSGLAFKRGVFVLNSPGTIDQDYRGEIKVCLANFSHHDVEIKRGDRIAQLVLVPVCRDLIRVVDELEHSERGEGGFGSTGVKS